MKSNLEDGAVGGTGKKRYVVFGAIVLALVIVAALFLNHFVARIVETEKLRTLIAGKTGKELGGSAGFLPLTAHGLIVESPGLLVTASAPRALRELRADHLSANLSLLELWRGKFRIEELSARHVQAAYGDEAGRLVNRSEFAQPEMVPASRTESPFSVDIRKVSIARADLFWQDPAKDGGQIRDAEVTCFPDGKNLVVHGKGGLFHQAKWPETRVNNLKLYYAKPSLRIDEGQLALGQRGTIDVRGEFKFEESASLDVQLKFEHCPIAPFLAKGNGDKIDGTFVGDAHLQKQVGQTESLSASGKITVEKAIMKNIAALEKAAAFTGNQQLSPLHLDEVRGDYHWEAQKLVVRDFRAEANHVLRVRGTFSYKDGEVDGSFELGVAPEIVAKFPGARQEVFTREEKDYLWTSVKVTGPLAHPNDDLKPRLISALEKHVAFGLLAPLLKPGQAAREVIELLFTH